MFRLKQNYTNLENEQYAENFKSYLHVDSARSSTNLTIHDLKNVLRALTNPNTQNSTAITTQQIMKQRKNTLKLDIILEHFETKILDVINGGWQLWKKL